MASQRAHYIVHVLFERFSLQIRPGLTEQHQGHEDCFETEKEIILESLQKIPSITQKISDYIGEEYTDFIALSRETPEKLRERVPGLSKAAAQAIIRRLSFLSD